MAFAGARMKELKKINPDMKGTDIFKQISADWKVATEKAKEPFVKLSNADKVRYEREMKEFKELGYFTNSDGVKSTFLMGKSRVVQEFETGTVLPK